MMSSEHYYNIGHRVELTYLHGNRIRVTGVIVSFSPNKYKIVLDNRTVLANNSEPGWFDVNRPYLTVGKLLTTEEMLTHHHKLVQELPNIVAMIESERNV